MLVGQWCSTWPAVDLVVSLIVYRCTVVNDRTVLQVVVCMMVCRDETVWYGMAKARKKKI